MAQIVVNLVESLGIELGDVGVFAPRNGDGWVQSQGGGVTETSDPQLGRLVAPADGAFQ